MIVAIKLIGIFLGVEGEGQGGNCPLAILPSCLLMINQGELDFFLDRKFKKVLY